MTKTKVSVVKIVDKPKYKYLMDEIRAEIKKETEEKRNSEEKGLADKEKSTQAKT